LLIGLVGGFDKLHRDGFKVEPAFVAVQKHSTTSKGGKSDVHEEF
jgi:hypothetical protein